MWPESSRAENEEFPMHTNEPNKDARHREDEFFYRRDQELLEAARRQAHAEEQLRELSAASGIADPGILQELQRFEYHARTVPLLRLMPLAAVAWSDGSISGPEREEIFRIARRQGIEQEDESWVRLEQHLAARPSDELFRVSLRGLRGWLDHLPLRKRGQIETEVMLNCMTVAAVSGGLFGFGSKISGAEESALSDIVAALELRTVTPAGGPGR
jgi:hypothetical protein